MSTVLDPLVSEFDTDDAAQDYDRWFRAKVQEAIDSKTPRIPHDEAVVLVRGMLDQRRKARAGRSLGE